MCIYSQLIICGGYWVFSCIDVCSAYMQVRLHRPMLKTPKSQGERSAVYFLSSLRGPLNHVIFTWGPPWASTICSVTGLCAWGREMVSCAVSLWSVAWALHCWVKESAHLLMGKYCHTAFEEKYHLTFLSAVHETALASTRCEQLLNLCHYYKWKLVF